jgi:hypothetical protein
MLLKRLDIYVLIDAVKFDADGVFAVHMAKTNANGVYARDYGGARALDRPTRTYYLSHQRERVQVEHR